MYTVAALMAFHVTLCKCPALHVFKQEACRIYLVTDTIVFYHVIRDYGHCTHVCVAYQDGACCVYNIFYGNGLHHVYNI